MKFVSNKRRLFILGRERSGKTSLAKVLFGEFYDKGFVPVLLTGDQITAQEAYRLGLVNRVVPGAELLAHAKALAASLAAKAPIAIRYILEAVHKGLEMPFPQAQIFEATLFGLVASTDDMREGTRAFLEKRKADFKGT